jgi:RNA polymerase sigma-70 factor (ECF subfamily)
MVAFIAGIMRSLRSEHARRAHGGRRACEPLQVERLRDPRADLEQSLMAREEIESIERLFVGDSEVQGLLQGLMEGLSPAQIRAALKISKTAYDSARKRLRRTLLKEGLTCAQN